MTDRTIGIVGFGRIAQTHLAAAHKLGYRVAAASSKPGEAVLRAGADAAYPGIEEMLGRERLEFAVVCLPTTLHAAAACTCMEGGCDVLIEKPFALDAADMDRVAAVSERTGQRYMVAHVCRFMGQYRALFDLVRGGKLGAPVKLELWRITQEPAWGAGQWFSDRAKSGGTLMDLMIHDLDIAQWVLGDVKDCRMMRRGRPGSRAAYESVSALMSFEGQAVAEVACSHLMPEGYPAENGFRLCAAEGALECSVRGGRDGQLVLYRDGEQQDLSEKLQDADPFVEQMRHFAGCIRDGAPFVVSPEQARGAVELVRRLERNEVLS